jgi:hypothetical protein
VGRSDALEIGMNPARARHNTGRAAGGRRMFVSPQDRRVVRGARHSLFSAITVMVCLPVGGWSLFEGTGWIPAGDVDVVSTLHGSAR